MKPLLVVLCTLLGAVNLPAESLEKILARMDESAPNFKAMSADVKMTTFTAIIKDTTVEDGKLQMQRQKGGKGTRAVIDFSAQSDARVIALYGKTARIYYPKLKLYQDYDVAQNSDVLNQFLLLGFGSSGKELMANYDITSPGTEKISGQETTKLVLIPKLDKAKKTLGKVEVWIPTGETYPIQQQFFQEKGNYRLVAYSGVKLNPPSIKGTLEYKLPPGAKRQSTEGR